MPDPIIVAVPTNLNDVYIRVFEAFSARFDMERAEKHAKEAVKFMAAYQDKQEERKP